MAIKAKSEQHWAIYLTTVFRIPIPQGKNLRSLKIIVLLDVKSNSKKLLFLTTYSKTTKTKIFLICLIGCITILSDVKANSKKLFVKKTYIKKLII